MTVQIDYRKFYHEQNFIHHIQNSQVACVMLSQGACHPRTSDKQNITPSLNIPVGYFLAQSWAVRLGRRWELAFLVEETVGVFTTNVSMSKFLIGFHQKKIHFAEKLTTSLIFHTYTSNKYERFRLANLNKGHVCVTPICDSLRMRLVPGPRHAK